MNAGILTKAATDSVMQTWSDKMPRERIGKTSVSTRALRVGLLFFIAALGMSPQGSANAATAARTAVAQLPGQLTGNRHNGKGSGNGNRNGNGKHNKSDITANSPTFNRGIQHTNNGNVGGRYIDAKAFCKAKLRVCRIVQKVTAGR